MKRILSFVLVVVALLGAIACADNAPIVVTEGSRQVAVKADSKSAYDTKVVNGNSWAVPQGMDLNKFPIFGRKLTEDDVIRLGLRLDRLEEDTILFNENRSRHAFPAEIIKAKEKVWKDSNGVVRYKEDCGNRAEVPADIFKCPSSVTCPGPHVTTGDPNSKKSAAAVPVVPDATKKARIWNWDWFVDAAQWLLGLALLLALAIFLGWLLYQLFRWMRGWATQPVGPVPTLVTPVVVPPAPTTGPFLVPPTPPVIPPTPPVVPPPAPIVPVAPVSTTTVTRYGPFKAVRVEDLGTRGYRAYGDGAPIGDFTNPVATEDAGVAGHYVVVTTTT